MHQKQPPPNVARWVLESEVFGDSAEVFMAAKATIRQSNKCNGAGRCRLPGGKVVFAAVSEVLMVSFISDCVLNLEIFARPSIVIPLKTVFRYGGSGVC